jgi:hypothetical protein
LSDFDDDEPNKGSARNDDPREPRGSNPAADDDWDDDDWDDDDRGGRRDMTLIIVIAVAVAVIALVVILTRPKDDKTPNPGTTAPTQTTGGGGPCKDWPAIIGGAGKSVASGEGVYVWSDFQGWHVRSSRTDPVVVKMTAPSAIKVKAKGNAVASSNSAPSVTLTIPPGDGKTGPDLDLDCNVSTVDIEVSANGTDVKPTEIKLGDSGKADSNPVTIARGTP